MLYICQGSAMRGCIRLELVKIADLLSFYNFMVTSYSLVILLIQCLFKRVIMSLFLKISSWIFFFWYIHFLIWHSLLFKWYIYFNCCYSLVYFYHVMLAFYFWYQHYLVPLDSVVFFTEMLFVSPSSPTTIP